MPHSSTGWARKRILIIGKAYPEVSRKHTETVCTGGITEDGNLVRLYPIPFRYLRPETKFGMWTWIRADITRNETDPRIESQKVKENTIEVLRETISDVDKTKLILPLVSQSHLILDEYYRKQYGSLGFLRIEPLELVVEKGDEDWKAQQQAILRQLRLFGEQPKPLEKLKWLFKLRYRCWQIPACKGHKQRLLTWNIYEGLRRFIPKYGGENQALEKVREQFWRIFSARKHCYLLLSTHRRYPVWMIGAYFCPDQSTVSKAEAALRTASLF